MDSSSSSMSRGAAVSIEREHMFDKVVTPSDVGKLNRLVIPKQHAEKYLPLINSPSSTEKGLLLNFEDREGKLWRFRYSYWSSSQSYVITKGWSRFVKEKQLDAGDVVSFERGVGGVEIHRLFINSRHRPYARPDLMSCMAAMQHHQLQFQQSIRWNSPCYFGSPISSMPQLQPLNFNKYPYYDQHRICNNDGFRMVNYGPNSVQRLTPMDRHHHMGRIQHGVDDSSMVIDSVPVVQGSSQAKRIRLFGVNMDCPISGETRCNILNSEPILYDDNKGNSVLSYHSLLPSSSHHGEAPPPQCSQGNFSGK